MKWRCDFSYRIGTVSRMEYVNESRDIYFADSWPPAEHHLVPLALVRLIIFIGRASDLLVRLPTQYFFIDNCDDNYGIEGPDWSRLLGATAVSVRAFTACVCTVSVRAMAVRPKRASEWVRENLMNSIVYCAVCVGGWREREKAPRELYTHERREESCVRSDGGLSLFGWLDYRKMTAVYQPHTHTHRFNSIATKKGIAQCIILPPTSARPLLNAYKNRVGENWENAVWVCVV